MKALTLTIHKVWSMSKFLAVTDKEIERQGIKKIFEYESNVLITVDLKHCPHAELYHS